MIGGVFSGLLALSGPQGDYYSAERLHNAAVVCTFTHGSRPEDENRKVVIVACGYVGQDQKVQNVAGGVVDSLLGEADAQELEKILLNATQDAVQSERRRHPSG